MTDSHNNYAITVEGLGTFTMAKRTMRRDLATAVEKAKITENVPLPAFQEMFVSAICDLKVLLVEWPEDTDWSPAGLDEMDPYDDETYGRVLKVWGALREKEETFRKPGKAVQEGGEKPLG